MNVAIIGGGLSGLRAALTLARADCRVTLFEKNRHLGGRVFSFPTADFGEIDIGQHIWLKCCTALEGLLRDLAVPDAWVYRQDRFTIYYKRPGASDFLFSSSLLPGLLHLLPPLLRFPGLRWRDLWRLSCGMIRARLYTTRQLEALDGITFADWLRRHRQTPAAVTRLWEPIVLGVCNVRADEVSARHALFTFRESLLKSKHAADFCFLRRPLSAVFDRHARSVLTAAGVEVRTGSTVRTVHPGTPPQIIVTESPSPPYSGERGWGEGDGLHCAARQYTHTQPLTPDPSPRSTGARGAVRIEYQHIVLAVPLRRQRDLLPDSAHLPEPPPNEPIAGLLLKFARPVMDELFFLGLDSPIQVVFNKTAIWEEQSSNQVIEIVISGARREARLGVEKLSAELLPELAKLLPRVNETPLLAARLLLHGGATFGVPPGREAQRLGPLRSDYPGIVFAGDQAATGWPSTMESAVRAGQAAAEAVLAAQALAARARIAMTMTADTMT